MAIAPVGPLQDQPLSLVSWRRDAHSHHRARLVQHCAQQLFGRFGDVYQVRFGQLAPGVAIFTGFLHQPDRAPENIWNLPLVLVSTGARRRQFPVWPATAVQFIPAMDLGCKPQEHPLHDFAALVSDDLLKGISKLGPLRIIHGLVLVAQADQQNRSVLLECGIPASSPLPACTARSFSVGQRSSHP
ncbi:MAG: hypothetical protein CWE10_15900 [Symbiobacterium thermophilum]|uniref:Uncharacterized protein n=1 Tax=Symbiobacterium thermophilum TaxID=2734 RepID=A0A953LHU1_SYMTR|nr:hypothetical protein [Symbiobacterium thermophilum]